MSYVLMKLYSFECDAAETACSTTEDVLPWGGTGLRGAVRELKRGAKWTVVGTGRDAKTYCPAHPPAEAKDDSEGGT